MSTTSIEWCDRVWNCVRGCSVVSAGCTNCYAMRQAHRFSAPGQPYEGLTRARTKFGPVWTGDVRFVPAKLVEPLSWRKPQRIFVNSMSDLFHEGVSGPQIAAVFGIMAAASQHTFQVLTKRPERARDFDSARLRTTRGNPAEARRALKETSLGKTLGGLGAGAVQQLASLAQWPLPNVWLGVSVEDQQTADKRIPLLLECPAALRWVSYEPALGPIDFRRFLEPIQKSRAITASMVSAGFDVILEPCGLRYPQWIVCGGESGPGARPFDLAWARTTIEQCRAAGVPAFFKQGGSRPIIDGTLLRLRDRKGGDLAELPEDLRVREFPHAA
jgi:protein gp37